MATINIWLQNFKFSFIRETVEKDIQEWMIQMNDRRKEGLEINKSLAPNEARTYELRLLSLL